jgi:isochorismate hydrolase
MQTLQTLVKGFQILKLPIFVTEQYPKGLGTTVNSLKNCLDPHQEYLSKTTFSCLHDEGIKNKLMQSPVNQWIIAGIEAHVCVLQTAKSLLMSDHQVVILNDAISSRSIFDFSTAIAEMRDCGARISSTETVLFELVRDSLAPEFKEISRLLK